ncbi:MAG: ROK family transcriptional regulator [Gammaproteobacteria bacterium]|nr:ROK family transcriptional regulator [Gammaproteobacteria bacterium]
MTLHSTHELRAINRVAVLGELARAGALSRADIAENTGLTLAAISRITRELIDAGVVVEQQDPQKPEGRGRHTRLLALSTTTATMVMMVISANRRAVALANCRGDIIKSIELPDLDLSEAINAIDVFCKTAESLIDHSDIALEKILGVSVVVAVNTDPATNDNISSPVLGWNNVAAKSRIEDRLKLPVHLEARAVALLESELWHYPAQHNQSIVLINNGWRIGSSVYANNQLLQTESGRLGQIAHLQVQGTARQCYCGQIGCLDALASGAAIVESLERAQLMHFDSTQPLNKRLASAIKESEHNREVSELFRVAGEHLGEGLKSVVALFSPERILVAGSTCRQTDYLIGVRKRLAPPLNYHANCQLAACTVTSLDAAVKSGLKAFLLTDTLNINRLTEPRKVS